METRCWLRFIRIIVIVVLISETCSAFDDGDFQYWDTTEFSFDLNKDWEFTFEEELRFQDEASRLYYHHSEMGFVYSGFADWVEFGLNYRQVFSRNNNDDWVTENRPHLNVTLMTKLAGLYLEDRSRLEYRDRNSKKDLWRYRNKFTVEFPKLTTLQLQPYIADEVFINFDREGYNNNRFYIGSSIKLTKTIEADIFYMWQSSRSDGGRKDINVLGFKLEIAF